MNRDPKGRHAQLFLVGTENFTDVVLEHQVLKQEVGVDDHQEMRCRCVCIGCVARNLS